VIFTMAVLETSRSSEPYRSVMGFFQVPTRLYPWVLMAVIQVTTLCYNSLEMHNTSYFYEAHRLNANRCIDTLLHGAKSVHSVST
jgi:hypothetical protein